MLKGRILVFKQKKKHLMTRANVIKNLSTVFVLLMMLMELEHINNDARSL